jgi:SPP1 family predicted phage head-tail adaptor
MNSPIRLARQLVLEAPREEGDGSGGYHVTWVELGRLWAAVEPRRGRELFASDRTRSTVPYRIIVRAAPIGAPSRPRPEQRFREGARIFDILSVTEAEYRGRYLEIEAEEGARL